MAEQKTVFADPRFKVARDEYQVAIEAKMGKMKIGWLKADRAVNESGEVPVPEPDCLMNLLGGMQAQLMGLRRELAVLHSIVKTLTYGLEDDQIDAVVENTVLDLDRQTGLLREQIANENAEASPLILPKSSRFNGNNGQN